MKGIILTEGQRDMLLEMAQTLFPDDGEQGYLPQEKIAIVEYKAGSTDFVYFERDGGCDHIHWLEFCIFYVQPKLKFYTSTLTMKALGSKYIEHLYSNFKSIYHAGERSIRKPNL